jgi:hypothetical protein
MNQCKDTVDLLYKRMISVAAYHILSDQGDDQLAPSGVEAHQIAGPPFQLHFLAPEEGYLWILPEEYSS